MTILSLDNSGPGENRTPVSALRTPRSAAELQAL